MLCCRSDEKAPRRLMPFGRLTLPLARMVARHKSGKAGKHESLCLRHRQKAAATVSATYVAPRTARFPPADGKSRPQAQARSEIANSQTLASTLSLHQGKINAVRSGNCVLAAGPWCDRPMRGVASCGELCMCLRPAAGGDKTCRAQLCEVVRFHQICVLLIRLLWYGGGEDL